MTFWISERVKEWCRNDFMINIHEGMWPCVFLAWTILQEVTKGIILPNYIQINPLESNKYPVAHNVKMMSYQRRCNVIMSHRCWYDIILMLCACWVFKVFNIDIVIGEIAPQLGGHVFFVFFLWLMMVWTILQEGNQKNNSAKLYQNWPNGFW